MNFFISGWAGFRQALDVPKEWHFIAPFIDFDEDGILNLLSHKSGSILIGWSTGGHIVLKNFEFFYERFEKIIIVAGFKKFTDYVNKKVIKRMIQKMQNEPEVVIKHFLLNAGCSLNLPENIDKQRLIIGLKFLIDSDIQNLKKYNLMDKKLILIHGKSDKILPFKAMFDLKNLFPEAETHLVEGSHWVSFNKILKLPVEKGGFSLIPFFTCHPEAYAEGSHEGILRYRSE